MKILVVPCRRQLHGKRCVQRTFLYSTLFLSLLYPQITSFFLSHETCLETRQENANNMILIMTISSNPLFHIFFAINQTSTPLLFLGCVQRNLSFPFYQVIMISWRSELSGFYPSPPSNNIYSFTKQKDFQTLPFLTSPSLYPLPSPLTPSLLPN